MIDVLKCVCIVVALVVVVSVSVCLHRSNPFAENGPQNKLVCPAKKECPGGRKGKQGRLTRHHLSEKAL